MDYSDEHEILAMCGSFPYLRFIHSNLQSLIDQSKEIDKMCRNNDV